MNVRKAVITAAGRGQRQLPLQVVADHDGANRTVLEMLVREAVSAGIEEVGVVVSPGDSAPYRQALGTAANGVSFFEQREPKGYADAILTAADFIGDHAFLHFVGDHLFLSRDGVSTAKKLVETAVREQCAVSGVQATREGALPFYGTIGGRLFGGNTQGLYEVEHVLEKPTPTQAEQTLIVPGMRAGHYLCFVGMHVLTPAVVKLLRKVGERATLSDALALLARQEKYLALETTDVRFNVGVKHGLLMAQLALALGGPERDDVLTSLVELLARDRR